MRSVAIAAELGRSESEKMKSGKEGEKRRESHVDFDEWEEP